MTGGELIEFIRHMMKFNPQAHVKLLRDLMTLIYLNLLI
ncbi:hypothetical protein Xentx_01193 [Xenorhabdus thuongxuanensis]|uniref:Uncharacterized protein n=1 Tax=Xenorhabdus thuongxuanensis TaxID=1873484 RepID=A0A1Q5U5R3_9GAMM|nr:hypothetical protein Xentx_01193 [Xenorhabdus thuongxuanensis]